MQLDLLSGDAFAWLAAQPDGSIDHVICDPPYDERTHAGQRSHGKTESVIDFAALQAGDVERLVPELLRVSLRWVMCFCTMEQIGAYQDAAAEAWVRAGFWRRPDGPPQFTGDRPAIAGDALAIMHRPGRKRWNGGGCHAYWECGMERRDRCHPTQKPLALMRALVEDFTDAGELVADPFAGSGSTGVACAQLGRRFVGVERRDDYAALARERLAAAVEGQSLADRMAGQTTLFGGAGR